MDSREQALAAVAAGRVRVAGSEAVKASTLVAPDQPVELVGDAPRFVSRGGDKLDAALTRFGIEVTGRRCLDAGASTGGFSDCLLQRGAASVTAVDVGRGQLHARVRDDERVRVLDGTNVRYLQLDAVGHMAFDLVAADLSFISLRTVIPVLAGAMAAPGADLVLLVKPQFEVGRREASRGRGVVREPALWRRVLEEVCSALTESGAAIMGVMVSPLRGAEGNVEYLVHARAHTGGGETPSAAASTTAAVESAVAEATNDSASEGKGVGEARP